MANNIVKLDNGQQVILEEWLHWVQFSTMEFAGQSKVNLHAFQYTVGQRVPSSGLPSRTATELDTNMVAKGRVNNDEELIVFGFTHETLALSNGAQDPTVYPAAGSIAAYAPGVSVHNLRELQRQCMVEFIVGAKITKPQIRSHYAALGSSIGAEVHGTVNPAGNINRSEGTSGPVSAKNQWKLELPMQIESDRMVKLRFFSPTALSLQNQDIRIRWYLDCLKRRPFG